MQREANGSAGANDWYAPTLANTAFSVPRAGRSARASRRSSAMAPHTSLPCVRPWIVTHGPAREDAKRHTYGRPALPSDHRVMSGKSTSIAGAAIPRLRRCETLGQALHERFAACELLEADPLVGLVRLRDVTRSAQHGRHRRI